MNRQMRYDRLSYNTPGLQSPNRVSTDSANNHHRPARVQSFGQSAVIPPPPIRNTTNSNYAPPPPQNNNNQGINSAALSRLAAISKVKYLNPLARLQYEDRETEVFTKITKQSREQAIKKIKARNQLASFQDDDQFDEDKEIDDLLEFKFGKIQASNVQGNGSKNVYFQKQMFPTAEEQEAVRATPMFCAVCDQLYFQVGDHQNCCFQYSANSNVRREQIADRINRIYEMLNTLNTAHSNYIKKILIDVTYNDSRQQLGLCAERIQNLDTEDDELINTIRKRAVMLIKEKAALREYIGPKLMEGA